MQEMKFVRYMEERKRRNQEKQRERMKQRNSLLYVGSTWYLYAAKNQVVIVFIFLDLCLSAHDT
jgi:hypothetical protein